jgi:phospholipase/carboxylesterase
MPEINYWRTDRPAEGPRTEPLSPGLPVRTYLPKQYEPRYPYPLVLLFHGRGGNEEQVLRLAPRMSPQNFVFISLRGPESLGQRADGRPACGWGHPEPDAFCEEYVRLVVALARRTYHIHSERIYLAGVNEGCEPAYRAAFALADKIGGVIALNGSLPTRIPGHPLFRFDAVRKLRAFIGHGIGNVECQRNNAHRDYRLLYAAGANVRYQTYPTGHKLHGDMLKDVNRWIIGNVNAECGLYVSP